MGGSLACGMVMIRPNPLKFTDVCATDVREKERHIRLIVIRGCAHLPDNRGNYVAWHS